MTALLGLGLCTSREQQADFLSSIEHAACCQEVKPEKREGDAAFILQTSADL